jgi:peptide methionine sulfoxide reductase MsrA
MNQVQRNFKKEIKLVEQEKKRYWRKEHYHDRYTGKNYIRFYDEHGTLLKTQEASISVNGLIKAFVSVIGVIIIIGILIFVWFKFHMIIF